MSQSDYIRPHDMMPDDQHHVVKGEVTIRKGTVAAALENARIFEDPSSSHAEKKAALEGILALKDALIGSGLMTLLQWKNAEIQALFDAEDECG